MNYNLIYYGNKLLEEPAKEVANIDGSLAGLIDSMYKIMYKANGIGLAAPQIGLSSRIIVIDTKEDGSSPIAVINPVIKQKSDSLIIYEEGCLSLPGIMFDVKRPEKILVSGLDLNAKEIEIEAKGLLARVFQHEIDHLNGVLFIDYIEQHVRNEFRSELKRIKKLNKTDA